MATAILMPALSPTMTEGKLAQWLKAEGDVVAAGDVLAEIETDKATMEVEAVDEGVLAKIVVPGGTEGVAVNAVIAVLADEGEDAAGVDVDALSTLPSPAPIAAPSAAPSAVRPRRVPRNRHPPPRQRRPLSPRPPQRRSHRQLQRRPRRRPRGFSPARWPVAWPATPGSI